MPGLETLAAGVMGGGSGNTGAGIGSILGAGFSYFTGRKQKKEGNALINQKFPEYQIPTEVTQAAAEGLPSEQYAMAMKNIDRQRMASIAGSQDRRGGLATIANTQQIANDATGKLDVANAQARQANQLRLGQYKDKQWQTNVKDKYNRDFQYGMSLLGAGNQNTNTAFDKLGAGLGMIAGGSMYGGRSGAKKDGSYNQALDDSTY
jgi:hypothetical protein